MKQEWWKSAVVYQIYPQSFQDSNGDGFGDLTGIIQRLDYLEKLGVDTLWVCPVFDSPMVDNGYDVKNYYDIMPQFGTLHDYEMLLQEAHKRDMKVIMDVVFNHTSEDHPWFRQSFDKNSKYHNYYIWRDSADGHEPNNWKSIFGGSAWEYRAEADAYYLHLFYKQQPDLNWEEPEVRQELRKILEFWCEKGVDGFRFDAINLFSKPQDESDMDDPYHVATYANGPHVHQYLQELLNGLAEKYNIVLIGQTDAVKPEDALLYTGTDRREFHMIFQYELDNYGNGSPMLKWHMDRPSVLEIRDIFSRWEKTLAGKGWNTICLGSHDMSRCISRYGDVEHYWKDSAKMLATFQMSLQGTPFIYQGDELGMTNTSFAKIEDFKDSEVKNFYRDFVDTGKVPQDVFMKAAAFRARDNSRTPMQWSGGYEAGFTSGKAWMPVNPNYTHINVQAEQKDPDSILVYYQKLIHIRKDHSVFVDGAYQDVDSQNNAVYAFTRTGEKEQLLVICNFANKSAKVTIPEEFLTERTVFLIGNKSTNIELEDPQIKLEAFEARIYSREL